MNNLSGWKRTWKNSGLTRNWTDWPLQWLHYANQGNWRAGHCEFVIKLYSMVAMTWKEIIWNDSYFELWINIWKWEWSTQLNEQPNQLKTNLKLDLTCIYFAVQNISNFISTIRYIMCTVVGTHLTEVKKVMMKLSYMYMYCTRWG